MRILMFIGFAFEVVFFIVTGVFLALGNTFASITSFFIAICLAIFTGIQIKKEGMEQANEQNK